MATNHNSALHASFTWLGGFSFIFWILFAAFLVDWDGLRLAGYFVTGFFVDWVCRLLCSAGFSPDFRLANSNSLGELRQNK
jgi:hypothetical protein